MGCDGVPDRTCTCMYLHMCVCVSFVLDTNEIWRVPRGWFACLLYMLIIICAEKS